MNEQLAAYFGEAGLPSAGVGGLGSSSPWAEASKRPPPRKGCKPAKA
jgi:hypothetical protein